MFSLRRVGIYTDPQRVLTVLCSRFYAMLSSSLDEDYGEDN